MRRLLPFHSPLHFLIHSCKVCAITGEIFGSSQTPYHQSGVKSTAQEASLGTGPMATQRWVPSRGSARVSSSPTAGRLGAAGAKKIARLRRFFLRRPFGLPTSQGRGGLGCMDSTLALGAFRIARDAGGEVVDVNGNIVEPEKGD